MCLRLPVNEIGIGNEMRINLIKTSLNAIPGNEGESKAKVGIAKPRFFGDCYQEVMESMAENAVGKIFHL